MYYQADYFVGKLGQWPPVKYRANFFSHASLPAATDHADDTDQIRVIREIRGQ